jgi:hypothetical protein
MDKQFWFDIRDNKYVLPEGQSAAELTEELFSYIDSVDPELRDDIGYETFANWLEKRQYTPEQIRTYIMRLVINLQNGIGERDTDTVFSRAFSVLFLAEIIHNDNKRVYLQLDEVLSIFTKALAYLAEERDSRGYVPEKGWAHAIAHTADLFYVLASNRFLTRVELEQMLNAIADKITEPIDQAYLHNEEDRLVRVVIAAHQRQLLDEFFFQTWLKSFVAAKKHNWKRSFESEPLHMAYFNTRNFLRSLYMRVVQAEKLFNKDWLANEISKTLLELKQF